MPGLYGISSNANISVYNTTGLYNVGNANVVIRGNVGSSNTTGLYQALGNPVILTSAQILLSLLSQSGNVNFALTNSNTQVLAYDLINSSQYTYYTNANVAAYLATNTDPTIQTIFIGQQELNANLGAFEIYANATFGTSSYGNTQVAAFLPIYGGEVLTNYIDFSTSAVRVGQGAGSTAQSSQAVAVGQGAGQANQSVNGVAIGAAAGQINQGQGAIAIGASAGQTSQGQYAIAIGQQSGVTTQGNLAIALGYLAGDSPQADNSIIINATGTGLEDASTSGLFIAPIRNDATNNTQVLFYNTSTKELTYTTLSIPDTYSNANVAAYLATNTDATIQSIFANIQTTNANLGAFETYANIHFGDSNYSNVNVAAYIPTDPTITGIQANLGAYQIATNANLGTVTTNLQTLDANVGAYEIATNANLGTATTNITTLFANAGVQANGINNLNANLGAYETWANATFSVSSYSNTNVAAFLPTYGGNISANNVLVTNQVQTAYVQLTTSNVRIGLQAAASSSGGVAIGEGAGSASQGPYSVAIGQNAGNGTGIAAISIGPNAGLTAQGNYSIAIGQYSGASIAANAVAIGTNVGRSAQIGQNSIVIGTDAGQTGTAANVIMLNATGQQLAGNTTGAFYVNPIRNDVGNVTLGIYYNTATKEVTYATATAGTTYSNTNVAAYLPTYTGNLNSVTLNQANVSNYLQFNTVPAAVSWVPGRLFWDTTANTLAYYNDNSQMTVNIGEETIIRVRNQTGADMFNGNVVYIDGATGNTPTANLAIATTFRTADIIGMLTTDIANNGFGYATINGIVNGLNTNAIAAGTPIYVSATTPGAYTITEPTAPNYSVQVGVVIRSNPSVGSVLVSPQQISTEAQHIVGVLPISSGGTNSNAIPTAGAVTYGNGTAFAFTAVGTAGQVLSSAGTGTPTWITPYGDANVAVYLPTYSGNIGVNGGNITLNSNNRLGPVIQGDLNTFAFVGTQNSGGVGLLFEGNTGNPPVDQIIVVNKDNIFLRTNNGSYNWSFDKSGNITLPSNIASINYANGTSILSGTGSSGTYGNTQVAAFLPTYTGNISAGNVIINSNNIIGPAYGDPNSVAFTATGDSNGAALLWSSPAGPNNTMFVNNAAAYIRTNIVTSNLTWTFDKTGNLTLPSNTANILYANGTSILSGTGSGGTYGNVQVAAYIQGTVLNPFLLSGM